MENSAIWQRAFRVQQQRTKLILISLAIARMPVTVYVRQSHLQYQLEHLHRCAAAEWRRCCYSVSDYWVWEMRKNSHLFEWILNAPNRIATMFHEYSWDDTRQGCLTIWSREHGAFVFRCHAQVSADNGPIYSDILNLCTSFISRAREISLSRLI